MDRAFGLVIPYFVAEGQRCGAGPFVIRIDIAVSVDIFQFSDSDFAPGRRIVEVVEVVGFVEFPTDRWHPLDALVFAAGTRRAVDMDLDPPTFGIFVVWLLGIFVVWLLGIFVVWLLGIFVVWLLGIFVVWLLGIFVVWLLGIFVDWLLRKPHPVGYTVPVVEIQRDGRSRGRVHAIERHLDRTVPGGGLRAGRWRRDGAQEGRQQGRADSGNRTPPSGTSKPSPQGWKHHIRTA